MKKYDADEILISFAELKKGQNEYKLNVSMKTLSNKHEHGYLKEYFALSGYDVAALTSEAFYKVLNTDMTNQYDLKNLDIQIVDNLEVEAIFVPENFASWAMLCKALKNMPSVYRVQIVEFNWYDMIVSIVFKSTLEEFRADLKQIGYKLMDIDRKFVIKKE
jgi:DUF2075 family protein